jgi:Ca2+-binding EF-hand superfamily protein
MTSITSGGLTQQLYQRVFDHLDVDKSDGLSLEELKAVGGESQDHASAFKTLDADTDGKISRAEMTGSSVALSNDTLSALVDAQKEPAERTALAANKGTLGLLDGARSEQETQDISDLFARADVDGDGKLSDAEWAAEKALRRSSNLDAGTISGPVFMAVDADGDGLTSTDEVRAGRGAPLPLSAVATAAPVAAVEIDPSIAGGATNTSGEATQQSAEQAQADWAERTSGGEGTYKFLDRELAAYRSAARIDFSGMTMSDALSTRLINQILAGLETRTDDLTQQVSA